MAASRGIRAIVGRVTSRPLFRAAMAVLSVLCAAPSDCGGGSGGGIATNSYVIPPQTTDALNGGVGAVGPVNPALLGPATGPDVDRVIRQAMNEATARGRPATIAVVDRVGNVLGVIQMTGAFCAVTITSGRNVGTGLENQAVLAPGGAAGVAPCANPLGAPPAPARAFVPSTLAAIAKAVTGAYLSSGGNAFTTRTASQIVHEHFNPGVRDTPSGPLFGVQFSQLPCSDFNRSLGDGVPGPQRSPLGLSADPGGLPIYKHGVLVGGIGVVSDPNYSLDANIFDFDQNTPAGDDDEIIALAGVSGYEAPQPIQAQNISAGGVTLRYVDATTANFAAPVALAAEPFGTAAEVRANGYYAANGPLQGATWGQAVNGGGLIASGVFPDGTGPGGVGPQYAGVTDGQPWVFLDATTGAQRVPRMGFVPAGGNDITAPEARQIVINGLVTAFNTRGQIRIPTNSNAEISVAVVDLDGNILAQARTPDAPVFGADVSIQKARSVVYLSRNPHNPAPEGPGSAFTEISAIAAPPLPPSTALLGAPYTGRYADYMNDLTLGDPTLFSSGTAFSERAIGDVSRPYYPDDIDGGPAGPLSLPFGSWSPFSTGLQLDLDTFDIAAYGIGGAPPPPTGCNAGTVANPLLPINATVAGEPAHTKLADGLMIFAGGEPLYRNGVLVGAVGVSGDGTQQDDMISFLSIQNLNGLDGLANAPAGIRADQITLDGAPLIYVNCPFAPFLDNRVQNAC